MSTNGKVSQQFIIMLIVVYNTIFVRYWKSFALTLSCMDYVNLSQDVLLLL